VRQAHSAIEHLTRSRPNCRTPGSFSCRFLSWPVREGPPASLYASPARDVARNTRSVPRLHTPSSGSLSAPPASMSAGVIGAVRVNACPSECFLCSRKTICPEHLATERPDARRVPTSHLASEARTSRRDAVGAPVLPASARQPKGVAGNRVCAVLRDTPPSFAAICREEPACPCRSRIAPLSFQPIRGRSAEYLGRFRADSCDGPRARVLLHPIVQIKRGIWRDLHPDLPGRTLAIARPPASSTAHPSRLAVEGWRSRT